LFRIFIRADGHINDERFAFMVSEVEDADITAFFYIFGCDTFPLSVFVDLDQTPVEA
jgi:hypothetical protein